MINRSGTDVQPNSSLLVCQILEEQHVNRHPGDLFVDTPPHSSLFECCRYWWRTSPAGTCWHSLQSNYLFIFNFDSEVTTVGNLLLGPTLKWVTPHPTLHTMFRLLSPTTPPMILRCIIHRITPPSDHWHSYNRYKELKLFIYFII